MATKLDPNVELLKLFSEREAAMIQELAAQGALVTLKTLAEKLGVTESWIEKAVVNEQLFKVHELLPAFFADDTLDQKEVQRICMQLGQLPGTSKWQFFTTPRLSLGRRSPLESLRMGRYEDVLATARAFAEM